MSQSFFRHFDHPPLLFAVAYVGYIGQNGGLGLWVSLGFFALIAAALQIPQYLPRWLAHKAAAQTLVGLMCLSSIPVALLGNGLPSGAVFFLASTLLYMVSNFCVAYQFATDFRPLAISWRNFWLVPQLWGASGHILAMIYNGGATIFALPIVIAMSWLAFSPKIGRWNLPRNVPNYLAALYNIWYAACNFMGAAPNVYVVISCLSCAVAFCLLAKRVRAGELAVAAEQATALEVAQAQETPIDPVLVELPNISFSLAQHRHWDRSWADGIFPLPPTGLSR